MHGSLHAVVLSDGVATVVGPAGLVYRGEPSGIGAAGSDASGSNATGSMPGWTPPAGIRWAWWSAHEMAALRGLVDVSRSWDIAEVHRLLAGGPAASPALAWAFTHDLPLDQVPDPLGGDLFDLLGDVSAGAQDGLTTAAGHLSPVTADAQWQRAHPVEWAGAALEVADSQVERISERPRGLSTATSESGAAWLCVELEQDGLPIDRPRMEELIGQLAGPRPADDNDAIAIREQRDWLVLQHVPGMRVDLRNPAQVRELLRAVGVHLDDTRAWHLEPYRHVHPVVDALLTWRKAERIATTYGWSWLDRFVGPDDRLRGRWSACDGGAGRMTAGAGLHSLPTRLRPGVAADEGHVFVRADLGQVEPRVLAVVSQDTAFAAATAEPDLYATVAAQLGLERAQAKIAVLAAMYGQTSGPAADALARMDHAYPVAMDFLRRHATDGEAGTDVMTYGGRVVRVPVAEERARRRAYGRFARNAVVQGSAAELFKAWALTVRAAVLPLDGQIVLCLHDELLVHVPQKHAAEAADRVATALADAARRWSQGAPVRFVADIGVFTRWSEAKG